MSITTAVLCITIYISVSFSLKCYECDDLEDKLCRNPREHNCSDKLNAACYTMDYYTFQWNDHYVLKGCTDKCTTMYSVNAGLETSFELNCCDGDLCNGPQGENHSGDQSGDKMEPVRIDSNDSFTLQPKNNSGPKKLVQPKISSYENGSGCCRNNSFMFVLTLCILLVVTQ